MLHVFFLLKKFCLTSFPLCVPPCPGSLCGFEVHSDDGSGELRLPSIEGGGGKKKKWENRLVLE